MKTKVSYINLLKEALHEYDTKSIDFKGPMLDPIISYDGGGELETHRDAQSVLERFYFKEKDNDSRLFVEQDAQNEEPEENEIVTGEEADDVDDTMDDLKDELMEDLMFEDDEEGGEFDGIADVPPEFEKEDGGEFEGMAESVENSVIEKLISEMEEFESADDEGTTQAGTDLASEKEVDKVLEDLELEMFMIEQEEGGEKEDEGEGDEKEDLDVDKKVAESSYGLGIKQTAKDEVEEAFRIFKEQIEATEEDPKDEETDKKEDEVAEAFMFEDDDVDPEDEGGEEGEESDEDKLKEALMFEDDDVEPEDEGSEEDKKEDEDELKEALGLI